jgi:dienelactone hydrolase
VDFDDGYWLGGECAGFVDRSVGMRIAITVAFFAYLPLRSQTIEVTPNRVMLDESATIRATGCQPNERLAIHAELIDGADMRWAAQADFAADALGTIDTSKQSPTGGSYKEVSAMGLIWSMMPASKKAERYLPPRNFGAQAIEFRLMRGSTQLAAAHLEQRPIAEGVERVALHDGALRGTLFLPPGNDRHPAVLVLGGSEGGLPSRRAAWLASHGYAALALAYFRYDDLPNELAGIPLEYFGHALNWMAHRPEVAADRIAVMGVSRGAELALQLGSMFVGVKAVVAYSPSNVLNPACCGFTTVPYAWSWNGNGLAFRPLRANLDQQGMAMRAVIEVEHSQGPILLVAGEDDHVWDSSAMADAIVARLKKFHFAYNVDELKYPHAGHGAGRAEIVPAWQGEVKNPTSGREMEMGGTPKGNAESTLDAIPKVLAFLQQSLPAH